MALSICNTVADERGHEMIMHGTSPFPIGCYHDNLIADPVPWHWHEELEAVVVDQGECIFSVGSERYPLRKGDGIFINASVLHSAVETGSDGCHLHSICFHPRLIGGSPDSIFWHHYLSPMLSDVSFYCFYLDQSVGWQKEAIDAIENAWHACAQEPPGYEFLVRNYLSGLIWLSASHRPLMKTRPSEKALRDGERIKTMLQYIQEHYSEEINTRQIAGSAMISSSECLRCFRSTIGTTPIQYVKQYRIQQASLLLATTNQKIVDIGTQCGFQEMSYFAKTFRELIGCTPSEYRKEKQADEKH